MLIDSGATHSFASLKSMRRLEKLFEQLDVKYSVSLPSWESMNSGQILHGCTILVDGRELYVDLIALDMIDYEVILIIDWLSKYYTSNDCMKKIVTFQPPEEEELLFIGITKK